MLLKKKILVSTRVITGERQGQFCYSSASRDSEQALGRSRDSAEARFVWPAKIKTQMGAADFCKYTEPKQSRKGKGLFKLKNSVGTRKAGDELVYD